MKLASKFSVFAMGFAIATASHSASAMPVLRMSETLAAFNAEGSESPVIAGLDSTLLGCRFNQINTIQAVESDGQVAMLAESEAAELMLESLVGLPVNGVEGVAAANIDTLVAELLGDEANFSDALAELADAEVADGITSDTTNLTSSGGGGAFYGGAKNFMGGKAIIAGGHASHFSKPAYQGTIVTPHVVPAPAPQFDGTVISGDTGAAAPLPSGALAGMILLGALGTAHKARSLRKVLA